MLFSQLIGNASVKSQLRRMVSTHALPAVLLFHGPSGVGKRLFAEELALHLLASAGPADKHPDLHQIFPDKNGLHSIASIRELIEETALPPFTAPCKVFIIHSAEKMLPTSSNALLKTLEEPPQATSFILLATDVSALLPTVVSRCRNIPFQPLKATEISDYLAARYGEDASPDAHLVHFAEGSLEKLEALRTKVDDRASSVLDILQTGLHGKWFDSLQRLEESLKSSEKEEEQQPNENGETLFFILLYWMRDLCLLQAGGDSAQLYHREYQAVLEAHAKQLKPLNLQKIYSIIEKAQARLSCNMRPAAVWEEVLLSLRNQMALARTA